MSARAIALIGLSVLLAVQATAQDMASLHKGECEHIAILNDTSLSVGDYGLVAWVASGCHGPGAVVLAQAWERVPPDTGYLNALVNPSASLRDQRVCDAAMRTLRDGSRSTDTRLSAMIVALSFVDSSLSISLESLKENPHSRSIGHRSHVPTRPGAEPPRTENAQQILVVLDHLAVADSNAMVAQAAAFLVGDLEVLGIAAAQPLLGDPPKWCSAEPGMSTDLFLASVTRLMADSSYSDARYAMHVSAVAGTNIAMISRESDCERASRAVDKYFLKSGQKRRVKLAQAGRYYVVHPQVLPGEVGYLIVLDGVGRYLGNITS